MELAANHLTLPETTDGDKRVQQGGYSERAMQIVQDESMLS